MEWFSYLKDRALAHFPNMPLALIEDAILSSASNFFRSTHLLVDEVYIPAVCGVTDYVFDIPDGRGVVQVKSVHSTNDFSCYPLLSKDWRTILPAKEAHGCGFWVDLQGAEPSIKFSSELVKVGGAYAVVYSWAPFRESCSLPQHYIHKYVDTILSGALSSLYLVAPDTESFNASLSSYYRVEARTGIVKAQAEQQQNHTERTLFMKGEPFV